MADVDHTLESSSAQENFPLIIDLTLNETFIAAPKGFGSVALSMILHQNEPSILLQGEWVRKIGFKVGDSIRVVVRHKHLKVEQINVPAKSRYKYWGEDDNADEEDEEILSFDNFKDETDASNTDNDDKREREGEDRNGDAQGSENGNKNGNACRYCNGSTNGINNGNENGSASDDKGDVLAEVNDGVDCD